MMYPGVQGTAEAENIEMKICGGGGKHGGGKQCGENILIYFASAHLRMKFIS